MFFGSKREKPVPTEAGDLAGFYYDQGYNCAQSVILAASQTLKVDVPREVITGASSFSGGIGYSGCVCGALVGGSMFIGIISANHEKARKNKKTLSLSGKLHNAFMSNFGTTYCRELLNGRSFKDKESKQKCRDITVKTAGILVDLLNDYAR